VLHYKAAWAARHGQTEHVETCRAAAETFLRDHVVRWLPSFAGRLRALAGRGPYEAVARLLATALDAEAERLGVEIGEPVEPVSPSGDERVMGERGLCEGS
jgi:TorA maturation chaperone TorD